MSNFEKNIKEAFETFEEVLPSFEEKKEFLIDLHNSNYSSHNLDANSTKKIEHAVQLLIENARDDASRKLQQKNFAPVLAMMHKNSEEIVKEIKSSKVFFTQLIQLTVIFLFFKEIENEKHNHDHIREALLKTLKGIVPLL